MNLTIGDVLVETLDPEWDSMVVFFKFSSANEQNT